MGLKLEVKGKVLRLAPYLARIKGAVVFAPAMFEKCSVFTSQFQTEDREGRKHLLPVEEVRFQKTNEQAAPHVEPCIWAERETDLQNGQNCSDRKLN